MALLLRMRNQRVRKANEAVRAAMGDEAVSAGRPSKRMQDTEFFNLAGIGQA
jgi:hypothetical protein